MNYLKLFFQCWVCVLISVKKGLCFYQILKKKKKNAVVSASFLQPTEGLRASDVEGIEFPHHRNCSWRMQRRDVYKACERKMAETQRDMQRGQSRTPKCLSLFGAKEASSKRATKLLTVTHSCSCFLLTPSSPRSLPFPQPPSPAHTLQEPA